VYVRTHLTLGGVRKYLAKPRKARLTVVKRTVYLHFLCAPSYCIHVRSRDSASFFDAEDPFLITSGESCFNKLGIWDGRQSRCGNL